MGKGGFMTRHEHIFHNHNQKKIITRRTKTLSTVSMLIICVYTPCNTGGMNLVSPSSG